MNLPAICKEFGLTIVNGVCVTSSRKIAERFRKRHDHVLRDIERHLQSPNLGAVNWIRPTEYVDEQGVRRPCYLLTRNGLMFVVSAYTGDDIARIKIAYFLAFDAMEAALHDRDGLSWPQAFHTLRQTLGDIQTTVTANNTVCVATFDAVTKTAENVVDIRKIVKNRRREILPSTKAIHVDAINVLGGLCPADGRTRIVEAGQRILGASDFDHYYQNSYPDPDHTWLICVEMHAALTSGRISRDQLEGAFRLYQERRRGIGSPQKAFW